MISRRNIVQGLPSCLALVACTPWLTTRLAGSTSASWPRLSVLVSDTVSAAALGRELKVRYPELLASSSLDLLRSRLGGAAEMAPRLGPVTARKYYNMVVREDFAACRMVDCHGWQLAWSEAVVFALCADVPQNRI